MNILHTVIECIFIAVIMIITLLSHEIAHGYTAMFLGDNTAKWSGRLSLNPFRHINPRYAKWIFIGVFVGKLIPMLSFLSSLVMWVGFILLLQPVPINPANFQDPKKGMAITALAGPVVNLLIAFVSMFLWVAVSRTDIPYLTEYLFLFFQTLVMYNIQLAVFNLIPVPPLDGSRVLFAFLPSRYYFQIMQYERYVMLIFLAMVYMGVFDVLISRGAVNIFNAFFGIVSKVMGLM